MPANNVRDGSQWLDVWCVIETSSPCVHDILLWTLCRACIQWLVTSRSCVQWLVTSVQSMHTTACHVQSMHTTACHVQSMHTVACHVQSMHTMACHVRPEHAYNGLSTTAQVIPVIPRRARCPWTMVYDVPPLTISAARCNSRFNKRSVQL